MIRHSKPVAVESISRSNAISRSKSFRLRNGTEVGTLRCENPSDQVSSCCVGAGVIFNSMNCDPAGSLPIEARSDLVLLCVSNGNVSWDGDVFGIFRNRAPIDESKTTLLIVGVKADSNAVTIGLVWNLKRWGRAKLEL